MDNRGRTWSIGGALDPLSGRRRRTSARADPPGHGVNAPCGGLWEELLIKQTSGGKRRHLTSRFDWAAPRKPCVVIPDTFLPPPTAWRSQQRALLARHHGPDRVQLPPEVKLIFFCRGESLPDCFLLLRLFFFLLSSASKRRHCASLKYAKRPEQGRRTVGGFSRRKKPRTSTFV